MIQKISPGTLRGTIVAPPSKSYAQRAILAATLCKGDSNLRNLGTNNDTDALISVANSLGAHFSSETLSSRGNFICPSIDVGESGLATRMLIPVMALGDSPVSINGHGTLITRSMGFIKEPLSQFGATLHLSDEHLPATIQGPLHPAEIDLDCSQSSQFLSGLLFALPLLDGDSVIHVKNLASRPYIQVTLDVLSAFGIKIDVSGDTFTIPGNQSYKPCDYTIEGDWSGVSVFLAAPGRKTIRGLNAQSPQADRSILNLISPQITSSEITFYGRAPQPFTFDATDCPDLFPALAVLAARAVSGRSVITGTNRLLNKESNRLLSIRDEFAKMGVCVDISESNVMAIDGAQQIHAADVDSHGDHRIAMALAVLALCAQDGVTSITGAESVNKSYKNFWNDFKLLYRYE